MGILQQIKNVVQSYQADYLDPAGADFGIWIIKMTNKGLNRCLAHRLSKLAAEYDPKCGVE